MRSVLDTGLPLVPESRFLSGAFPSLHNLPKYPFERPDWSAHSDRV